MQSTTTMLPVLQRLAKVNMKRLFPCTTAILTPKTHKKSSQQQFSPNNNNRASSPTSLNEPLQIFSVKFLKEQLNKKNVNVPTRVFDEMNEGQVNRPFYGVFLFTSTSNQSKQHVNCVIDSGYNPILRWLEHLDETKGTTTTTASTINQRSSSSSQFITNNRQKKENVMSKKTTTPNSNRQQESKWDLVAVVYGFETRIEALEFEFLWKNPLRITGSKSFQQMMKQLKMSSENDSDEKSGSGNNVMNNIPAKLHVLFHLLTDPSSRFYRPLMNPEGKSILHVRFLSETCEGIAREYQFPIDKCLNHIVSCSAEQMQEHVLVALNTEPLIWNHQQQQQQQTSSPPTFDQPVKQFGASPRTQQVLTQEINTPSTQVNLGRKEPFSPRLKQFDDKEAKKNTEVLMCVKNYCVGCCVSSSQVPPTELQKIKLIQKHVHNCKLEAIRV